MSPMRLGSPALMAASHKKKAPPSGPNPMAAISNQSCVLRVVAGSSTTWHANDSTPDTAAKPPTAEVGTAATRRVSSE